MRPVFSCTIEALKSAFGRILRVVRARDLRSAEHQCQAASEWKQAQPGWRHPGDGALPGGPAPKRRIVEQAQCDLACPVLCSKRFRFPRRANHLYKLAPSCPTEGRAHVTNAGRDAVDAAGAFDER